MCVCVCVCSNSTTMTMKVYDNKKKVRELIQNLLDFLLFFKLKEEEKKNRE